MDAISLPALYSALRERSFDRAFFAAVVAVFTPALTVVPALFDVAAAAAAATVGVFASDEDGSTRLDGAEGKAGEEALRFLLPE